MYQCQVSFFCISPFSLLWDTKVNRFCLRYTDKTIYPQQLKKELEVKMLKLFFHFVQVKFLFNLAIFESFHNPHTEE